MKLVQKWNRNNISNFLCRETERWEISYNNKYIVFNLFLSCREIERRDNNPFHEMRIPKIVVQPNSPLVDRRVDPPAKENIRRSLPRIVLKDT